ncbi:MAG: hypothetical protein WKG07_33410 [Hymenobacter sp.]
MNRLKAYTAVRNQRLRWSRHGHGAVHESGAGRQDSPEDYSYQGRILARAGRADEGIDHACKKPLSLNDRPCQEGRNCRMTWLRLYTTKKDYSSGHWRV